MLKSQKEGETVGEREGGSQCLKTPSSLAAIHHFSVMCLQRLARPPVSAAELC